VILAYFVIASRKDWSWENRAFTMIAITISLFVWFIVVPIYAVIDMVTRPKPSHQTKATYIAIIILIPGVGILAYFIWALQTKNRTEPRVAPPRQPIPVSVHESLSPPEQITFADDGTRALSNDDLDYLQKLADLRSQGVITDEQYETQRRQRIGE